MYILRWLKYIFWTSLIFPSCFHPSPRLRPEGRVAKADFYGLKFTTIDGNSFHFDQLKGKNVVILNTASSCGYTDQYADWEKFYQENKEEWVVLGFPCNQFLGQEKGNNKEIATFCQLNYGVSFPLFEKSNVKGKQQNPIYRWLTVDSLNGWNSQSPTWNFCKYIVDKKGQLLAFYPSKTKPGDLDFLNLKQHME
jgi:glutathione peroxidase